MSFDAFNPIKEKCEANDVKYATSVNELSETYTVWFKKRDWQTHIDVDLYIPFEKIIERVNERLDEFLKDVERGNTNVS